MRVSGKSLCVFFGSITGLLLLVILIALAPVPLAAQTCQLKVEVEDTYAFSGQNNAIIDVYLVNQVDTVAGFELWLVLNRPDIMEFVRDTVLKADIFYWRCLEWDGLLCVDSNDITDSVLLFGVDYDWLTADTHYVQAGVVDTTGTLVSGWDYVEARSLSPGGYDLKLTAMANDFAPPYNPGILPQDGSIPLIKLLVNVYDLPEEIQDRTVDILIQSDNLDNFAFSGMNGTGIGIILDTVYKERCFTCGPGIDPPCDPMWQVPCESPEVDSVWCCDTLLTAHLDLDYVCIINGSLTSVTTFVCGDVDGSGTVNILDVTRLISYLYKEGAGPDDFRAADVNGSCSTNILDVTALISYLYKQGFSMACPYFWPCP